MKKSERRVALYVRVDRKDDPYSTEAQAILQRDRLRHYCREHGLTVAGEYIDAGCNGLTAERESYRNLMEDAERGKINLILTASLDRLARAPLLRRETLDRLKKSGCRVIGVKDGFDSRTAITARA